VIGAGECELALAWPLVADALAGATDAERARRLGDLLTDELVEARSADSEFAALAPSLLPVLWGRGEAARLAGRAPDVLAFPFTAELVVTIAYPVPCGRRYLLKADVEGIEGRGGPALSAALSNLRRRTPPEAIQPLDDADEPLFGLDCPDGLDSSRLLVLPDLVPPWRANGLLAVAPAREMLSFVPFSHRGLSHLRHLLNLAANGYRSLPFPISDQLFYVAPSAAQAIGVEHLAGHAPRLSLPASLGEKQAELAAQGLW